MYVHVTCSRSVTPRLSPLLASVPESARGIDRIVHCRRTVMPSAQTEHDEILPMLHEILVTQPPACRQVRDQRPRLGDQIGRDLLTLLGCEIEGDRAFALVQARPVDRGPVVTDRPPVRVDVPADRCG